MTLENYSCLSINGATAVAISEAKPIIARLARDFQITELLISNQTAISEMKPKSAVAIIVM
jgi:hypothetical protein